MDDLISRKYLYDKMSEKEELARQRVLDTPTHSPAYLRYVAQFNERTALKHEIADAPTVEAVPKSYVDQIRWERDIAIEQLNEIGCQFGQKMDEVKKKLEASQWIPCGERLPEERESIFKKAKGTDKWDPEMFESISDDVNVTVEFEDGTRKTMTSYTTDGKWSCEKEYRIKMKVIAWCPLPEPYKGE